MAQKTYLQLVNEAMAESKVSVDQLTSADFATNDSHLLYGRFRTWVNQAYEELLLDRPEWLFRKERAVMTLWPRVILSGLTYTPSIGDILEGQSSGTIMTVKKVLAFEEAEQNGELEMTLAVGFDADTPPRNLIMRETFNRTSPTLLASVGQLLGPGRYDFAEDIAGFGAIDPDTLRVFSTPSRAVTRNENISSGHVVTEVPWYEWANEYTMYPWSGEFPRYISRTPQGSYALFPQPEGECTLTFDYTQEVELMSVYSDTPTVIPARFHDYLIWAAVAKFADWDRQGALYMRATKQADKYRGYMDRDMLPAVGFVGWNGVKIDG